MSKTILIVEDEPAVSTVVSHFLKSIGHNALIEPDPFNVLNDVERLGNVDLVITDNDMSGMQGSELTQKLKENHPEIKVIFTSGRMPSQSEQQSIPADAFLPKPYRAEVLRHKINQLLGITE